MTAVELERIARSIIPPVGATMAIARVDDQLKHRAAFLIDGRIHGTPVGPAFDRPRDAIALVNLLNGEAPRPGQPDLARDGERPDRRDAAGQPEAPGGASLSGPGAGLPPPALGSSTPPGPPGRRRAPAVASRSTVSHLGGDQGAALVSSPGLWPEP